MEASTQERGLSSVPEPEDETKPDETKPDPDPPEDDAGGSPEQADDGSDEAADPTSEEAAQKEEERAEEERQEAEAEAKGQLSWPIGGIRPATALFQVTGGEVEINAEQLPDKDEEMTIAVTGWVKTIKDSTTKKGVSASRTAVFVVEEVDLQRLAS